VRAQDAYRQLFVRTCGREREEVRVARDSHASRQAKPGSTTVGGHGAATTEDTARQHRPSLCRRDALGAHAAGRRREERRCRSVLAAVENQNSHTCDLDPRRLGEKPCKGRRSALTAEAHWLGRGYKLTPDTRALAGERVLPVPVAAPDVAACSHPYHAPLTIAWADDMIAESGSIS
jgi:hypothetical protein